MILFAAKNWEGDGADWILSLLGDCVVDTFDSFSGLSEGIALGLHLTTLAGDRSMSSALDCWISKSSWALKCESLLLAKFLGVVSLDCVEGVDFGEGRDNLSFIFLGAVSFEGTKGVNLGEGCCSWFLSTFLRVLGVLCVGSGDGTDLGEGTGIVGFRGLSFLSVMAWNFLALSSLLQGGFFGCGFRIPAVFSEI